MAEKATEGSLNKQAFLDIFCFGPSTSFECEPLLCYHDGVLGAKAAESTGLLSGFNAKPDPVREAWLLAKDKDGRQQPLKLAGTRHWQTDSDDMSITCGYSFPRDGNVTLELYVPIWAINYAPVSNTVPHFSVPPPSLAVCAPPPSFAVFAETCFPRTVSVPFMKYYRVLAVRRHDEGRQW